LQWEEIKDLLTDNRTEGIVPYITFCATSLKVNLTKGETV